MSPIQEEELRERVACQDVTFRELIWRIRSELNSAQQAFDLGHYHDSQRHSRLAADLTGALVGSGSASGTRSDLEVQLLASLSAYAGGYRYRGASSPLVARCRSALPSDSATASMFPTAHPERREPLRRVVILQGCVSA